MRNVIAEEGHIVQALAPVDIAGGKDSAVFSMKGHSHASILVLLGATGGASSIKLQACDDFVPTNTEDIPFSYYAEETAAGDTLSGRQAGAAAGVATSENDGVMYVVEVDAAELPEDKPNLRVVLADPGAATQGAVIAILSGGRYAGAQSPTVIA